MVGIGDIAESPYVSFFGFLPTAIVSLDILVMARCIVRDGLPSLIVSLILLYACVCTVILRWGIVVMAGHAIRGGLPSVALVPLHPAFILVGIIGPMNRQVRCGVLPLIIRSVFPPAMIRSIPCVAGQAVVRSLPAMILPWSSRIHHDRTVELLLPGLRGGERLRQRSIGTGRRRIVIAHPSCVLGIVIRPLLLPLGLEVFALTERVERLLMRPRPMLRFAPIE